MNRFTRVQPKQYVDTFTELPLQFLQGLAETKQKGFDAGLANADAAESLLNFNVAPGDVNHYQKLVGNYNDQISKVRDQLIQTGDYNQASRDIFGLSRKIAKDTNISQMKEFRKVWENAYETQSKDKNLALKSHWQKGEDLTKASSYDPILGGHRSRTIDLGYDAPDIHKHVKESFGTLKMNKETNGYDVWDASGVKHSITSSNGIIKEKDIDKRVEESLINYSQTPAFKDHYIEAVKSGYSPEEAQKFAIEKGRALLKAEGMQQMQYEIENTHRQNLPSKDDLAFLGINNNTPNSGWLPDTVSELKDGDKFDINSVTKKVADTSSPGNLYDVKTENLTSKNKYTNPTNLPENQKDLFTSYMIHTYGTDINSKGSKILQGKATQEDLKEVYEGFGKWYNASVKGIKMNNSARSITESKDTHTKYFGVSKDEVTLPDLINRAGTSGRETPIFNQTDNEWTTLGKVLDDAADNKKGVSDTKVHINKEYNPYNGFVKSAENNKIPDAHRFADAVAFTNSGDGKSYVMATPQSGLNSPDREQKLASNKIYSSQFTPRLPQEITVNGKTKYVVFEPNLNGDAYIQARENGEDVKGTYYVFNNPKEASLLAKNKAEYTSFYSPDLKGSEASIDPFHIYEYLKNKK